jgi:hypothetical protein
LVCSPIMIFDFVFSASVPVWFFCGVQSAFFSFLVRFSSCALRFHSTGSRFDRHHRSSRAQLAPPFFLSLSVSCRFCSPLGLLGPDLFVAEAIFGLASFAFFFPLRSSSARKVSRAGLVPARGSVPLSAQYLPPVDFCRQRFSSLNRAPVFLVLPPASLICLEIISLALIRALGACPVFVAFGAHVFKAWFWFLIFDFTAQ